MEFDVRIETIELKKMMASDGMVLTNGEAYGKEVYLGKNDSAENWHEITDEEYKKILEEQEKEINAEALI